MTALHQRARQALMGCAGALALLLGFEVWAPVPAIDPPAVERLAETTLPPTMPALRGVALDQLAARPVFVATRRPIDVAVQPVLAAAPPIIAPPPATTLVLIGIVGDRTGRLAVIRQNGIPKPIRIAEGGEIAGWSVVRILDDHVVLQAGGGDQELSFPPTGQQRGAAGGNFVRPFTGQPSIVIPAPQHRP